MQLKVCGKSGDGQGARRLAALAGHWTKHPPRSRDREVPCTPRLDAVELRRLRRDPIPSRERILNGKFRKGPVPRDTSPPAQCRRAVKRHHGNARPYTLRRIERRNRKAAVMLLDGASLAVAGLLVGLSRVHVRTVAHRRGVRFDHGARRWGRVLGASVLTPQRGGRLPSPPGVEAGEGWGEGPVVAGRSATARGKPPDPPPPVPHTPTGASRRAPPTPPDDPYPLRPCKCAGDGLCGGPWPCRVRERERERERERGTR